MRQSIESSKSRETTSLVPDISRVIRPFFSGFFSVTKYINATFDNMNKYAFKCMQNFKQIFLLKLRDWRNVDIMFVVSGQWAGESFELLQCKGNLPSLENFFQLF